MDFVLNAPLNGIDWKGAFALKSYGVKVGIRTNDKRVLKRAYHHLPRPWEETEGNKVERIYSIVIRNSRSATASRRQHLLYADDARLMRAPDLESILDVFESDLRLFVAEMATNRVFVHAGVVGWKNRAIVIPGRSYSGKSTLVAEFVRAGATYYSDEYAVFDARGRVHPFMKPLELRATGEFKQTKVTVDELGGSAGVKPLPVALVLMTRFTSEGRWRPRKLSTGKGILELLHNTVCARRSPERALVSLRSVACDADVLKGRRGEARAVVENVLARLERNRIV
jgi:hypothetical protein